MRWNDYRCGETNPYICQMPPVELPTIDCPAGWTGFCDPSGQCACYVYHSQPMPWRDASDYCTDRFAFLPSVHSMEEAKFLDELSHGAPTLPWIGLTRKDGYFVWSDGSVLDFANWRTRYSGKHSGDDDCIQMATTSYFEEYDPSLVDQALKWSTQICTDWREPFFCERLADASVEECDHSMIECLEVWTRFCYQGMLCSCYMHSTEKVSSFNEGDTFKFYM